VRQDRPRPILGAHCTPEPTSGKKKTAEKKIPSKEAKKAAVKALQAKAQIQVLTEEINRLLEFILGYQLQAGVDDFYFDGEDWFHLTEEEKVGVLQEKLERIVPSSIWHKITDPIRVFNPQKAEKALLRGNLTAKILEEAIEVSVNVGTRHQRPKVKATDAAKETKSSESAE